MTLTRWTEQDFKINPVFYYHILSTYNHLAKYFEAYQSYCFIDDYSLIFYHETVYFKKFYLKLFQYCRILSTHHCLEWHLLNHLCKIKHLYFLVATCLVDLRNCDISRIFSALRARQIVSNFRIVIKSMISYKKNECFVKLTGPQFEPP